MPRNMTPDIIETMMMPPPTTHIKVGDLVAYENGKGKQVFGTVTHFFPKGTKCSLINQLSGDKIYKMTPFNEDNGCTLPMHVVNWHNAENERQLCTSVEINMYRKYALFCMKA